MRSIAVYVVLGLTAFVLVRCSVPQPAPAPVPEPPQPAAVEVQEQPPPPGEKERFDEAVRKMGELHYGKFSRAAPGWKKKKVKKKGDID